MLFPACHTFRMIVVRIAMKIVDKSHRTTHNTGDASDLGAFDRVAHSRIINGNTHRIKLITGANPGFEMVVFIVTPSAINSTCSLKIPIPVSAKVQKMKRRRPSSIFVPGKDH